jgi:hypothetical protein
MELKIIYTERNFNNWPTWPLIYEWEDVIAASLNLELSDVIKASVTTYYLDKILRFVSRNIFGDNRLIIFADKIINKPLAIYFELLPRSSFYFTGSKNTIPVIIDFSKTLNLNLFYNAYKNCKVVLIANLQAYNYLKQCKCPLNIYHFPQSLADKYKIRPNSSFKKLYDVIIPGRVDSILLGFLKEYEKKFPDIECLYREYINEEFVYISSRTGICYKGQEREEYMNLLKASRVTLYSTVGIDGDNARTGGFSPVTPRFLEMVSAGCHIIARYPTNEETQYFELNKICISCDDYSLFEKELSKALNVAGPDLKLYESYLAKHYTSERAKQLKNILNALTE